MPTDTQVSVRVLGGLMALGYEIGTIMKRTSVLFEADGEVTIKFDDVEGLGQYVQVRAFPLGHVSCKRAVGLAAGAVPYLA